MDIHGDHDGLSRPFCEGIAIDAGKSVRRSCRAVADERTVYKDTVQGGRGELDLRLVPKRDGFQKG